MATDDTADPASIDWTAEGRRLPVAGRTALFVLVAVVSGAVLWYSWNVGELALLDRYDLDRTVEYRDWLFWLSVLAAVTYVVVPLVERRERTRTYWRRLRARPLGLLSLVYVLLFFAVGVFGPALTEPPTLDFAAQSQPPAFTSVRTLVAEECNGRVAGGKCYGTLADPFGTTRVGESVLTITVAGARVATQLAFVLAVVVVPVATLVGTVAAYVGGVVDEVLMRTVEILQVLPAVVVYFVAILVYGRSLLLLVVVFGLTSWGGVARVVRAETLRLREREYVTASRAAGGSRAHVLRHHIVRNVSSTVLPAVTLQIPTVIFVEAGLAFLDLSDPELLSWGNIIAQGIAHFNTRWWVASVPLVVLVVTLLAFNVLGDTLRDVLDPRLE